MCQYTGGSETGVSVDVHVGNVCVSTQVHQRCVCHYTNVSVYSSVRDACVGRFACHPLIDLQW